MMALTTPKLSLGILCAFCASFAGSMSLHHSRCAPTKATLVPSASSKLMRGKEWFETAMQSSEDQADAVETVSTARQEGRAILAEYPELIPSARDEAWRFTDLKKFWRVEASSSSSSSAQSVPSDAWYLDVDADILCVVVDGVVSTELSRGLDDAEEEGAARYVGRARRVDRSLVEERPVEVDIERANPNSAMGSAPWAALNAACLSDAVVVTASGDESIAAHVVHVSTGTRPLTHPRLSVVAKDRSSIEVHQTFVSLDDAGKVMTNSRTTIDVDDEASVLHVYASAHAAPNAVQVEACTAKVKGEYEATVVCLGSELARLGFDTGLEKSEAKSTINSLVLAGESSNNVDFRTQIRHEVREANSDQDVRIVVAEKASATFKGRISVPQVAQLTDATQLCRTALLSETASVNVMPSLEIIANDVKCTHGATVADLDGESLFFLMARGLTRDTAQALLVRGFCDSLLETLPNSINPKLRSTIDAKIESLVVSN